MPVKKQKKSIVVNHFIHEVFSIKVSYSIENSVYIENKRKTYHSHYTGMKSVKYDIKYDLNIDFT